MTTPFPRSLSLLSSLPLLSCLGAALPGQAQQLWSNPWSNYTTVRSIVSTAPDIDIEAADDFDVQGTITRVVFDADDCWQCLPPVVLGATVRFYSWANGSPGALQQEAFVPVGSPALLFDPTMLATVDVTLPVPFLATGRHFVSLQVHFQGGGMFDIWASGVGAFNLSPARVRNRLAGGPWVQPTISAASTSPLFADLTFQLFGQAAGSTGPVSIPCTTWSELPTAPPPAAQYSLLRAVKAFAPNDVWAAGSWMAGPLGQYDQFTLVTHWDGTSWSQIPSPSPSPAPGLTECILFALDGVATNDLWAAGTFKTQVNGGWVGQQVFAMHWDGVSWTVPPGLPLPATSVGAGISGSTIVDVEAEASDDVWFVGDWLDIVSASSGQTTRPGFLMHWNGGSFQHTVLPVVTGVGHQYFSSVAAAGANDVWVAGGAGIAGNLPGSPVPVLFRFDGSSWTHTPCPTPNHPGWNVNLHHLDVLASDDVWVFGTSWTQMPTLQSENFLAHWDGSSWSLLPGPPPGTSAIAVVSANEIHGVGVAVSRFDGVAWSQVQTFTSQIDAGLNAIDVLGPCELWAVGGQSRIGKVTPFAARLDAPWYWRTQTRFPSIPSRAPGVLVTVTPPRIGAIAAVAIGDPGANITSPLALAFWQVSFAAAPGYPSPVVIPFGGSNGGAGELFVDPSAGFTTPLVAWAPSTGPSLHAILLPLDPMLLGFTVFTQGVLIDLAATPQLLLTNGLDLQIGF